MFNRNEAVTRALASKTNTPGGCYAWTRTQFGSPAVGDFDGDGDADAVDGWKATKVKHPGDRNPPRGVPVFWSGGSHGYGHAAVSLGGGKIRSTDAGGRGVVATVDLDWPERAWGLKYLGWSEDLAGVTIPLPPVQYTRKAPARRLYHDNTPIKYAGGTRGDSAAGTRAAKRGGYKWIDNNGHLTHRTGTGRLLGKKDTDVVWVNAHGSPYNPSWLKGRFEDLVWLTTKIRHPRLRSAAATFKQNAKAGLSTEWEVKDVRPLNSKATLDAAFQKLAASARKAYGPNWRERVVVKVLTNLSGGLEFALDVCEAAHGAGFQTMILPRGGDVHRVINEPTVTFNRGGRVS